MEIELNGTSIPVKLRQMTREEADTVIDWAAEEGWNPGLHDADAFYQTDPSGFFAIVAENNLAGSVALVRYSDDFMFGGLYIVHPDYRGKGIGRAILDFTKKYAEEYNLGIDGVFDLQKVYEKSGFRFAYRNIRFEGTGGGKIDNSLTILRKVPFPRVLVYDSLHYPAVRENFLKHFIYQLDSTGFAAIEGDSLTGYGFVRKCRNGYKIGPLFADTEEIAETIFSALSSVADREPLFLDVPEINRAAVTLAQSHDMKEVFGTARMYTKKIPKLPLDHIFGVTTFELG
ncbi:MAG TPA: GNAT family N-acetyltransferase [Methanoregulaceae archaeon]|nr:GNAT family N-acetyltransferase [Methanoregulaceae archaeon]